MQKMQFKKRSRNNFSSGTFLLCEFIAQLILQLQDDFKAAVYFHNTQINGEYKVIDRQLSELFRSA